MLNVYISITVITTHTYGFELEGFLVNISSLLICRVKCGRVCVRSGVMYTGIFYNLINLRGSMTFLSKALLLQFLTLFKYLQLRSDFIFSIKFPFFISMTYYR